MNETEPDSCVGAVLLTASHNPGGPTEDFGIKFNCQNGGPAQESLTNEIFKQSCEIQEYIQVSGLTLDLAEVKETNFGRVEGFEFDFEASLVDATALYVEMMESLFDFAQIKALLAREDFSICFDGMHGVSGPYAKEVFLNKLGVPAEQLMRCDVLPDFGKGHPDPNLTYAADLVKHMGVFDAEKKDAPAFGAACDGDADRNMILGKNFFVTPSDSVAIIVAHHKRIPYLREGITGAARSMPTSAALDNVCAEMNLPIYETPTGWKFFGNLLDANKISVCGEESFGTGSGHVREKDGLWAVLCWLQILADMNKDKPVGELVHVEHIVKDFWKNYGRNYYRRYDYEGLENEHADKIFALLDKHLEDFTKKAEGNTSTNFQYQDPIDGSLTKNQGYIFKYADGSRYVFRKSGTGSSGATIRIYLEKYNKDQTDLDVQEALK